MRPTPWLGAVLLAAGLATGCVDRRYVVTSDPPGALVYRNGQPIGTTPVDDYFVYYGKYHLTLVKDGYETLQIDPVLQAPWYEIPPLDFFSENLYPFKVRDIRRLHLQMQPALTVRPDDLLNRAQALRQRGQVLVPLGPDGKPAAPAAPALVGPPPTPPPAVFPTPPPGPVVQPPPEIAPRAGTGLNGPP